MAIMEACEVLIKENIQPPRDVYFSFGFDEEVGGELGAT